MLPHAPLKFNAIGGSGRFAGNRSLTPVDQKIHHVANVVMAECPAQLDEAGRAGCDDHEGCFTVDVLALQNVFRNPGVLDEVGSRTAAATVPGVPYATPCCRGVAG